MERWEAKLTSVFVIFALPFVSILAPHWVMPWIVRKGRIGERILGYLMCFGGGIFLGAFLLDMAPDVREELDAALLEPNGIAYPVTDLIIGCGFFFVLYLEKIVVRINKRRTQRKERRMQRCCIVYHGESGGGVGGGGVSATAGGKVCHNCRDGLKCIGYVNEGQTNDHNDNEVVVNSRIAIQVKDIEDSTGSSSSFSSSPHTRKTWADPEENVSNRIHVGVVTERGNNPVDAASVSSHGGGDDGGHHNVRSLILIVALSLHHIFEGLVIGLQDGGGGGGGGGVRGVFVLVAVLVSHESIVGFTLGLQFVRSGFSLRRMVVAGACCSAMTPVGIGLGMVASELGEQTGDSKIGGGVVLAFACGTFLYITFFEILQEEIEPHDTSLGKVTGAALGFATIALLSLLPHDEEEDGEESLAAEATTVFQIHQNASA